MRKKILLLLLGSALSFGGFFAYRAYVGDGVRWTFNRKRGSLTISGLPTGTGAENLLVESRAADGRLELILRAKRTEPAGTGQYVLIEPVAQFFTTDGTTLLLTADRGTIRVDTPGGSSAKPVPRGGSLSGHVRLLMGPQGSFAPGVAEPAPGHLLATLDQDITFDYQERLLRSPGGVHVHSDRAEFDGTDLTVALSTEQKRIDYLRIEKGEKIVLRDVQPESPNASTAPTATAPVAAAPSAPTATAKPHSDQATPATTYRLSFSDQVKTVLGERVLESQQLALVFQVATAAVNKRAETVRTEATPSVLNPSAATAPAVPTPTVEPTPAPAKAAPKKSLGSDLVITWSGPLEMRPATDVTLVGPKDVQLEAVGTAAAPVKVQDGPERHGIAGKITLEATGQKLVMESVGDVPVELTDRSVGRLVCRGITALPQSGELRLQGPGHLEAAASALDRKPASDAKPPVVIDWQQQVAVNFATVPDRKHPGKTTQVPRHAVFTGNAVLNDGTSSIQGDTLDVQLASTADDKPVLEHLLATGRVTVGTDRIKATDTAPALRDSLACERLEVQTAAGPRGLQPARVLADGQVVARTHQGKKEKPGLWVLRTPHLVADLEPKTKGEPKAESKDGLGSSAVTQIVARDGVSVDITGLGPQPVVVSAAELRGDAKAGTAILLGVADDPARWAKLQQGENYLSGPTIHLDQKAQSAEIPSTGAFVFAQPGKAGEAATPVKLTWSDSMRYAGRDNEARFTGHVIASLQGKPDQQSELAADEVLVQLASERGEAAAAKPAGAADLGGAKSRLSRIVATARGTEADGSPKRVRATGVSLDAAGQPLTRMLLLGPQVVYDETGKKLSIPGPGSMLLEDYRPDTAKPRGTKPGDNPLAGGSTRGRTALAWGEALTFDGRGNVITLTRNVQVVHQPTHPLTTKGLELPAGSKKTVATAPAAISEITLDCQKLSIALESGKGASASPVALGDAGTSKISKLLIDGGGLLKFDQNQVAAEVIEYDAAAGKAEAYGRSGNPATAIRAGQPGTFAADRIVWDLTQGSDGITFIRPRGVISTP